MTSEHKLAAIITVAIAIVILGFTVSGILSSHDAYKYGYRGPQTTPSCWGKACE